MSLMVLGIVVPWLIVRCADVGRAVPEGSGEILRQHNPEEGRPGAGEANQPRPPSHHRRFPPAFRR
jgi:hypothetical protein